MTASSVTGVGPGSSNKIGTRELAILTNGPAILMAGYVEVEGGIASPPSALTVVTLPRPLAGGAENYIVLLTTLNGGTAYITDMGEDGGNFTDFTITAESDCSVMYMVVKTGIRPEIS